MQLTSTLLKLIFSTSAILLSVLSMLSDNRIDNFTLLSLYFDISNKIITSCSIISQISNTKSSQNIMFAFQNICDIIPFGEDIFISYD